jgi:hypothetical protein
MSESEMQSSVAAHGNAGDGAIGAAGANAVVAFDEGKEFLKEKIFVAEFVVAGIDIEGGFAGGGGDEEILEAAFFAKIFDQVPAVGVEKGLLVVAEAVKEIEDGEAARSVGVKAGRQEDAIRNGASEDFAGDGVALDAAGSGLSGREIKEVQAGEEKEKAYSSLRSG